MNKISIFLFTLSLMPACQNSVKKTTSSEAGITRDKTLLKKADWLLGQWKSTFPGSFSVETWKKENDSVYSANSFFIEGKDTASSESIQLAQKGNEVYYIPTVKNQNGGQPVFFRMTASTDKEMVFENANHDYPQKISYRNVSSDSLIAIISGRQRGNQRADSFSMRRVK